MGFLPDWYSVKEYPVRVGCDFVFGQYDFFDLFILFGFIKVHYNICTACFTCELKLSELNHSLITTLLLANGRSFFKCCEKVLDGMASAIIFWISLCMRADQRLHQACQLFQFIRRASCCGLLLVSWSTWISVSWLALALCQLWPSFSGHYDLLDKFSCPTFTSDTTCKSARTAKEANENHTKSNPPINHLFCLVFFCCIHTHLFPPPVT